jgi:hypothetical protein
MKIKQIDFSDINGEIILDRPITCFKGNVSERYMLLIEAMIGTYRRDSSVSVAMPHESIIHGCVEIDKKEYDVCYIYSVDAEHTMGVNFTKGKRFFSLSDTVEYDEKRRAWNINACHIFADEDMRSSTACLPMSEKALLSFKKFLTTLKKDTNNGDFRPIFIYHFFDRIDESVDISSCIDELASLGRQVFISVCSNYPTEKMKHNKVQVINVEADNVKD